MLFFPSVIWRGRKRDERDRKNDQPTTEQTDMGVGLPIEKSFKKTLLFLTPSSLGPEQLTKQLVF